MAQAQLKQVTRVERRDRSLIFTSRDTPLMEEMTEQIFWLDMENSGDRFRESGLMGLARGQVCMKWAPPRL